MTQTNIELALYGTRGSCPKGDPKFMEFGGDTSSYTLRLGDALHLWDAGTGVQEALNSELTPDVKRVEMDISHTHLDHINMGCAGQLYFNNVPDHIQIVGCEGVRQGLERAFDGEYLWPVDLEHMGGLNKVITECHGGEEFQHPGYVVRTLRNWHPRGPTRDGDGGSLGFRYDIQTTEGGIYSVAYVTDMTFRYDNKGQPLPGSEQRINDFVRFVQGADVLVADTQYSEDDFATMPFLKGFGHPALEEVIDYATRAGVKLLLGTHHDTKQTDELLRAKEQFGREYGRSVGFQGDFGMARQGERIIAPYRMAI